VTRAVRFREAVLEEIRQAGGKVPLREKNRGCRSGSSSPRCTRSPGTAAAARARCASRI
jgi:hypothetical protein